jgi:6-pyruvoyltetrahydropterin/6-carboxytetrahydropterin synthase
LNERFELRRSYGFEAAHYLPQAPDGHPCRRVHGHSYEVEIQVVGEVDEPAGWVIDFAEIDNVFEPVRELLDHRLLNDLEGLENPTSELLARWIWQRMGSALPGLAAVAVRETPHSTCIYRGPGP